MDKNQSYTQARKADMDDSLEGSFRPDVPDDFNWWDALGVVSITLTEIKLRDDYTPDWKTLIDYAADWVTCACGAQCANIPRFENGKPKDSLLKMYGKQFLIDVENENPTAAAYTLHNIEQRATALIKFYENWERISKSFDHMDI